MTTSCDKALAMSDGAIITIHILERGLERLICAALTTADDSSQEAS